MRSGKNYQAGNDTETTYNETENLNLYAYFSPNIFSGYGDDDNVEYLNTCKYINYS